MNNSTIDLIALGDQKAIKIARVLIKPQYDNSPDPDSIKPGYVNLAIPIIVDWRKDKISRNVYLLDEKGMRAFEPFLMDPQRPLVPFRIGEVAYSEISNASDDAPRITSYYGLEEKTGLAYLNRREGEIFNSLGIFTAYVVFEKDLFRVFPKLDPKNK